ncbi:hypothetical protein ACHHYP_11578 [Achlya hypogyna]|uniref:Transmembrane protein n=1 Tax=Achlya hypogyna TaxID=1202772 RepID=A0A1V9YIW9_ACHHY|nr:hypothetical protein ACHHYP_11578 [Achlya hypogyna]
MAPWIFTQYCYLDFNRTWSMAYSARRQMRCQSMLTNGAVFLESVLRNIDWGDWTTCWGDAFAIAFGNELQTTSQGQAWLHEVATAGLSLANEATYWRAHGIQSFDVQWQNYKRIGAINSYSITNAYGVTYPMTLVSFNGTYRFESQTTFKMYWSLANDLTAVMNNASGIGGTSLLRGSSHFAFANTTMQAVLTTNLTIMAPLANGLALVQSLLGPFGVVDMFYIRVPSSLLSLTRDVIDLARRGMGDDVDAQALYTSIVPNAVSCPIPKHWLEANLQTYGSNPLCPEYLASKPLQACFSDLVSFDLACLPGVPMPSRVTATQQFYLVAAILAGVNTMDPIDYRSICAFDISYIEACSVYLNQTVTFIRTYMPTANSTFANAVARINTEIGALNIEFMVYTKVNGSLALLHTAVLDPAVPAFSFFGWTYLYGWIAGFREVVSFTGDHGSLTLLTDEAPPLTQAVQSWQMATNFAQYCQSGVWYVTCMMLSVALLVSGYIVAIGGHFEGLNMLELSRVGGIVWVGRPLLFLRSLTALCLLSTGSLELVYSGYISRFAAPRTPWYKVALAAGETTWLVSVANDISLIVTKEHAALFVTPNSLIVWFVVAILSAVVPVAATSTIDLSCAVVEMDLQVKCTSGGIAIGDFGRLVLLHCVVIGCNVASFLITKRRVRRLAPCRINSLIMSSGAKYLFLHTTRFIDGVYYIDRASAALTGILTYRYNDQVYALDIKLWRLIVSPVHDLDVPEWPGTQAELAATYALVD